MIELLNFIFQNFFNFIGFIFLVLIIGAVISNILKSFRLFEININQHTPQSPQINQSVFNELVKLWNKRHNKDDDDK